MRTAADERSEKVLIDIGHDVTLTARDFEQRRTLSPLCRFSDYLLS